MQASIVGKRIGKHRWSPSTTKTVEGSLAFALSVLAGAYILRLCGLTEMFSVSYNPIPSLSLSLSLPFQPIIDQPIQLVRYTTVVGLSATLEALSDQNDNLTLPLFMWSMLAIANV
jgi:dolichol kinase